MNDCFGLDMSRIFVVQSKNVSDVKGITNQCQNLKPPLHTIKTDYPFQKLSWDIVGPLPTCMRGHSGGDRPIHVFSKWVEAFPLVETDSITLANVLTDEIVCRYGVPDVIHSDKGSNLSVR